jgi:molecular chaperone DnaJ
VGRLHCYFRSGSQVADTDSEGNAAYEQIKNPEKAEPAGGYGYDPYGGYRQTHTGEDPYQQGAYNYIRMGRYQEALNILSNSTSRNARWYYLSALANNGLDNQVTALEHMRRAVSMEPDNPEYLRALNIMESGGDAYRQRAGDFQGFSMGGNPCASVCLCYLAQMCCFGRPIFFCC